MLSLAQCVCVTEHAQMTVPSQFISCIKINASIVFWCRQCLVHSSSSTYIFAKAFSPTLQHGLSVPADLHLT